MKSEFETKNTMISLIESLKDNFEDDDMEYMEITEIKLCQEDHKWGHYNQEVLGLMQRIKLLKNILEIEEDEFEKIFNSVSRRKE